MFWLIDVLAVIVLLAVVYIGFRNGLFGMVTGAVVYLFRIAFAFAGAFLFLLLFQKIGAVDALTLGFARLFGKSAEFAIVGSLPNIFATVVFLIIGFVLAYLIVMFAFHFLEKLARNAKVNGGTLGVLDCVFGMIVAAIFFFAVYSFILAVIRAFANQGALEYFDELLTACPLTGIIYRHNAFVPVIENTGIVAKILHPIG